MTVYELEKKPYKLDRLAAIWYSGHQVAVSDCSQYYIQIMLSLRTYIIHYFAGIFAAGLYSTLAIIIAM